MSSAVCLEVRDRLQEITDQSGSGDSGPHESPTARAYGKCKRIRLEAGGSRRVGEVHGASLVAAGGEFWCSCPLTLVHADQGQDSVRYLSEPLSMRVDLHTEHGRPVKYGLLEVTAQAARALAKVAARIGGRTTVQLP